MIFTIVYFRLPACGGDPVGESAAWLAAVVYLMTIFWTMTLLPSVRRSR